MVLLPVLAGYKAIGLLHDLRLPFPHGEGRITIDLPDPGEILGWKALAPRFAVFLFGIYYKYFLGGGVWATGVGLWLETEVWSKAYGKLLQSLSNALDRFFGEKLFGWRAFDRCFVIAMFYAMMWLWISIAASASNPDARYGFLIGSALAAPVGLVCFLLARQIRRSHEAARRMNPAAKRRLRFREYLFYFLIGGSAGAVAGAVAVITLFLGLPLVNALFDWPSWAASRWLIRRLKRDIAVQPLWRRASRLAAHSLLDISLALLSLLGLAIVLGTLFTGSGVWKAARDTPLSLEGSTLSVMLLSTLVPTAIHLFCAAFALLPALPFGHSKAAFFIPAKYEGFEPMDKAIVAGWLTLWTLASLALLYGMFWVGAQALDMLAWPIEWPDGRRRDFWRSLFYVAESAAGWIKGLF